MDGILYFSLTLLFLPIPKIISSKIIQCLLAIFTTLFNINERIKNAIIRTITATQLN